MKRIATCTDQLSIVLETDALLFANCDQAFFNSLLRQAALTFRPAPTFPSSDNVTVGQERRLLINRFPAADQATFAVS